MRQGLPQVSSDKLYLRGEYELYLVLSEPLIPRAGDYRRTYLLCGMLVSIHVVLGALGW